MLFHRYELYADGESQKVGFIVGLSEVLSAMSCDRFADEYIDSLLDRFNDELPFPPQNIARDNVCVFTELGNVVFSQEIARIKEAYEITMFDVKELIVEVSDDEIDKLPYMDQFQACVPINLYTQSKRDPNQTV